MHRIVGESFLEGTPGPHTGPCHPAKDENHRSKSRIVLNVMSTSILVELFSFVEERLIVVCYSVFRRIFFSG